MSLAPPSPSPSHAGQVYEVSGPRLLTFSHAVSEIAEATGRAIGFQPVPIDDYMAEVPDDLAWLVRYLFTETRDRSNASLTDGVQRALGRPPRDFRDFTRATAASGVWRPQA